MWLVVLGQAMVETRQGGERFHARMARGVLWAGQAAAHLHGMLCDVFLLSFATPLSACPSSSLLLDAVVFVSSCL